MNTPAKSIESVRPLRELYFELGKSLLAHTRHAQAAQAFEQALKEDGPGPGRDDVLFNLAVAWERGDQDDRAFRSYLDAIVAAPQRLAEILPSAHKLLTPGLAATQGEWLDSDWVTSIKDADLTPRLQADLARFLGRVSLYRQNYTRAAELFEQALQNDRDNAQTLEGLGEAHWRIHNLSQALEFLGSAHEIARKGKYRDRLMAIDAKLAQVLVAAGEYQSALDRIAESLLEGDRFENELLLSRSQCYLALARPKEALEAAEAARERDPESVTAGLLCAQALISLGRCSDALKVVDEALQKDPLRADALLYKAQALFEGQIDLRQGRTLLARYAKRAGNDAVNPKTLPPALVTRKSDGNALYFMAELYRTLNYPDEALKVVNQALEAGLQFGVEYPDAPAQQLKGELLEKCGRLEEAATLLFEAGRRFSWRNDFDAALELLRHSAELNPKSAATYWQWSEALRMASYQTSVRQEDQKAAIEEAARVWDKSVGFGLPDRNQSWAYLSRAYTSELQARLLATDQRQRQNWLWEAIAFVERALLLYEPDATAWSSLGCYHRSLLNESNALQATQRAWELDAENSSVQDERAAILANVGELEEAEKVIDKRRTAAPNTWADGVKAYILAEKRKYKEALDLINTVVQADPEGLWNLDLRARCFLLLGDKQRAQADYRIIWSRYDATNFDKQTAFGVAAYYLDDIEQTIKIMANYPDDYQANWYLGASYLKQSKLDDGEQHLAKSVALARNSRELDDTLTEELPQLKSFSEGWPHAAQVSEILERIRNQAETRKVEFKRRTPEDELKTVLDILVLKEKLDAWTGISIHAELGRLHTKAGRYAEAASAYRLLIQYRDNFPEVEIATQQVAAGFEAEGDRLLKSTDLDGAIQQYRNGLDIPTDTTARGMTGEAKLRGKLGLTFFLHFDLDNARSEFGKVLHIHQQLRSENPGNVLAEICRPFLNDPKQLWALEDEWNNYATSVGTDQELRNHFATARKALTAFLVDWLERPVNTKPESRVPVVTPVVMEIGEGLVPEDTSENWSLFKTYIPAMRSRIENHTGVRVPGVLVRASNMLPRDGYALLLDEHWVAGGNIYLQMRYSPAKLDALQAVAMQHTAWVSARNPLTGKSGYWVPKEHWEAVSEHNLELWEEPLLYVTYHLEAVLRQNLADFLGVQEVANMVDLWGKTEEGSTLVKKVVCDDSTLVRFSRLLRALVRELVPIKEWKQIVLSAQASGLENLEAAVRAARLRLKDKLPGNESGTRRFELPAEWKHTINSWLKPSGSRCSFVPPPEQTHRFLLMLGDLLPSRDMNAAVVVDSSECRPYVRRLIESRFPYLMVLSKEELASTNESATPAPHMRRGQVKKKGVRTHGA